MALKEELTQKLGGKTLQEAETQRSTRRCFS